MPRFHGLDWTGLVSMRGYGVYGRMVAHIWKEGSDRLKLMWRYAMVDMGNQEARKSTDSKHDAGHEVCYQAP